MTDVEWLQPMPTDESDAVTRALVDMTGTVTIPEEMRWRTGALHDNYGVTVEFIHRPRTLRRVATVVWKTLCARDLYPPGWTLRNNFRRCLWMKQLHLRNDLREYQVRGNGGMTRTEFTVFLNGVNTGAHNALKAGRSDG